MKKFKASILGTSLIVMGVMIIIALGISFSSLQSRKSSIGSSKSNVAFQAADSGMEIMMQKIKMADPAGRVNEIDTTGIGTCNNGTFEVAGKFKIELKNATGTVGCTDLISTVEAIKATGYSDQDSRAIEVALAAGCDCGLGINQTWQNVMASRSKDVEYTNNTGKPIQVMVSALNITGDLRMSIFIGQASADTLLSTGGGEPVSFIVPNGWKYKLTGQAPPCGFICKNPPTISTWMELR